MLPIDGERAKKEKFAKAKSAKSKKKGKEYTYSAS